MALGEDASLEASEPQSVADPGESHDPETLFILDSIVQRLKPRDAHHVRDMIQNVQGLQEPYSFQAHCGGG